MNAVLIDKGVNYSSDTCYAHSYSPVGSGKTALTLALCRRLRKEYNIGNENSALLEGVSAYIELISELTSYCHK